MMIRILQVVSSLAKNGTETFIMNLFRNIDRDKFMFDFLVFTENKQGFYEEVLSLGSKVYFLPSRGTKIINYLISLNDFFKNHGKEYDVIHINTGNFSSIAPLYFAKKYNIPIRIIHSHSSSCTGWHNKIFHNLNKHSVPSLATNYLACSQKSKEWGFGSTKAYSATEIITNGIDLSKYSFNQVTRNRLRQQMQLEDKFVVGHIGTFNEIKNHSFLIDIFNQLTILNPNSVLLLVGEGPLLEKMKKKVNSLNLDEKVKFLGRCNNVNELLQAIDVMVMPSIFEGLSFAVIEAQAAGLPVIASSGVTLESKASNYFHTLPLTDPISTWCDYILKYTSYNRKTIDDSDSINRFSIGNTVNQVSSIYDNKSITSL